MRDSKTRDYISSLSERDQEIIKLFNQNYVNIAKYMGIKKSVASTVTGKYIAFLQMTHTRAVNTENLLGKDEPYYTDELEYGSEYYRLELAKQMYG